MGDRRPAKGRAGELPTVWHRRVWVERGTTASGRPLNVLVSSRDAPLSERGAKVWHLCVAAVVVLGVVLIGVSILSR